MKRTLKKLFKNASSLTGILLLLMFILIAIFAPLLTPSYQDYMKHGFMMFPDDPYQIPLNFNSTPSAPDKFNIMGVTGGGYDIYYGIIWGTRSAFRIGLIVVGSCAIIGIIIGSFSAYFGGWVDEIIMRITDIFMSFPFLVAAMVMTAILGKGLNNVMIALIVFGWMGYARLIRASVLVAKEDVYVSAARALGASNFRIVFRHILPNTIYPNLIQASMDMGSMVITAAALSFLGVGSEPGYADWGQMISFARNWIITPGHGMEYWYTFLYPGLAIVLFSLSWNLVGDALRDILDPRLRGQLK